jgi:hypothetical protein
MAELSAAEQFQLEFRRKAAAEVERANNVMAAAAVAAACGQRSSAKVDITLYPKQQEQERRRRRGQPQQQQQQQQQQYVRRRKRSAVAPFTAKPPPPPLLKGDRVQKLGGFGGGEIGTVVEVNFKGTIALVMSDTGHLFAAQPPQNFKRVPLGDYWEPRAMSRREARGRERAAASLRGAPARLFPPVPVDKKGVQAVAEEEASEAGGEGGGSYFVRSAAPGAAAAKLRLPPRLRPPEPLPALPELPRGVGRISDLQHRLKAREAQRQQQRQQHDRRRQRQEQRFLRAQHQKQQQHQQQQQRGPSADSIPTGYVPPITAPAPPQRVACIAVDFEEPAVQTIDMRVRLPAMQQQQQEEDARPTPNPNIGRSVFG